MYQVLVSTDSVSTVGIYSTLENAQENAAIAFRTHMATDAGGFHGQLDENSLPYYANYTSKGRSGVLFANYPTPKSYAPEIRVSIEEVPVNADLNGESFEHSANPPPGSMPN